MAFDVEKGLKMQKISLLKSMYLKSGNFICRLPSAAFSLHKLICIHVCLSSVYLQQFLMGHAETQSFLIMYENTQFGIGILNMTYTQYQICYGVFLCVYSAK